MYIFRQFNSFYVFKKITQLIWHYLKLLLKETYFKKLNTLLRLQIHKNNLLNVKVVTFSWIVNWFSEIDRSKFTSSGVVADLKIQIMLHLRLCFMSMPNIVIIWITELKPVVNGYPLNLSPFIFNCSQVKIFKSVLRLHS